MISHSTETSEFHQLGHSMPYTIIKLPNSKVLHLKGVPKHAVSLIASHKLMDWGNLEQFIRSTTIPLQESKKTTCMLCNSYIVTCLGLELGKTSLIAKIPIQNPNILLQSLNPPKSNDPTHKSNGQKRLGTKFYHRSHKEM
eukprot:TRINITY_DN41612_c3_g1_i1.p1 TRINITY_DN41612_c3_g1~~TRINITY_DN41612_c3_g1_i1.p1  ORF type:complete len:141 (-),score=5.68 TRINITY_DN41612_c3_g1_i1:111-533(-)